MTGSHESPYVERAHLLALLATHYPAFITEDTQFPDQPVLFLILPTGQATWHLDPGDLDLFTHVPATPTEVWDGHTTWEKYERVDLLTNLRGAVPRV